MPTYEYHCQNDHEFEVVQKMSDDAVSECPECGGAAERRISGGAGFIFKGDGFYITDNRSEDYQKKASAETSSSGSSKDTGSGSTSGGSDSGSSSGSSGSSSSDSGSSSSGSSSGSSSSSASRSSSSGGGSSDSGSS